MLIILVTGDGRLFCEIEVMEALDSIGRYKEFPTGPGQNSDQVQGGTDPQIVQEIRGGLRVLASVAVRGNMKGVSSSFAAVYLCRCRIRP